MIESDFAIGFKQGQSHGKEIMLEVIEDIRKEVELLKADGLANMDAVLHVIDKHLLIYKGGD